MGAARSIPGLRAHVRQYAGADDRRAWITLAWTGVGYAIALALYVVGWWPLAVLVCAGVIVRTFIIFHDAIHGAFFSRRQWNERLAVLLQPVLFTPAKPFRANHLAHHRVFGDLGADDGQDQILFTRQQFAAMPSWKRRCWRVARTPAVYFPVTLPVVLWVVEYSLLAGNLWIWSGLALHAAFAWLVSPWHVLALYLYTLSGGILFHLQHGLSGGWRRRSEDWRFEDAALKGSTWLAIPKPFTWCTLGIEFHHVHHLNPAVPCYRIAACHANAPEGAWQGVTRGTWRSCLQGMGNVMWDVERDELVRF